MLWLHTYLSLKESKDLICFIKANGRLTCLQFTDKADAYPGLHTEIQLSQSVLLAFLPHKLCNGHIC